MGLKSGEYAGIYFGLYFFAFNAAFTLDVLCIDALSITIVVPGGKGNDVMNDAKPFPV
jgi:hypothetical protein